MKKKLFNNIGLKLMALLVAILIWIIVVSVNDPIADKVYRDIPVTVLNEDVVTSEGKTYQIEDGISMVSVTVRAQRSVLSRLKEQDIEVDADLKEMTLSNLIPLDVKIKGYEGRYQKATPNPLNLQVNIEDTVTNKFPITVQPVGSLRDGFALASTSAEPQTVTISGPKSVIRSIDQAAAPIVLTGISGNKKVKSDLVLYDTDGEEIDQSRLTNNIGDKGIIVSVEVFPTKEVPIRIDEEAVSVGDGMYLADYSYEPTVVGIAAAKEQLSNIEEIVIPAEAFDLSNDEGKQEVTLELKDYLPEGAVLASEDDAKIVVTFQIAKLGEKVFDVPTGSVAIDNLRSGLEAEFAEGNDLEIKVSGPQKELDKLDLSKAVSVDLKRYTSEDTVKVPVLVKLPKQCTAAPLNVKIKLRKKEQ